MKAVLHAGDRPAWAGDLGLDNWLLAPVAGRPVLEYWFEACGRLGAREVVVVLGDGADEVEQWVEDGARWGLSVTYAFLLPGEDAAGFLRRSPGLGSGGILDVRRPAFPLYADADPPAAPFAGAGRSEGADGTTACLVCSGPAAAAAEAAPWPAADLGWEPSPLGSIKDFYDLNMLLLRGRLARYTRPGYFFNDGACVGSNVISPPGAAFHPPLVIGNDTRLCPLTVVGPEVALGNRCIVDRQSEIRRAVVLDGTYIGSNLEIADKIVAGNRLIDPADGTVLEIAEPWMISSVQAGYHPVAVFRALAGRLVALVLLALMALPCLGLCAWLRLRHGRGDEAVVLGRGGRRLPVRVSPDAVLHGRSFAARLYLALSLDRFGPLRHVLNGRLYLCGQDPLVLPGEEPLRSELKVYVPAVFSYGTAERPQPDPLMRRVHALYYVHHRSVAEDARICFRALFRRLGWMLENAGRSPD